MMKRMSVVKVILSILLLADQCLKLRPGVWLTSLLEQTNNNSSDILLSGKLINWISRPVLLNNNLTDETSGES